MNLSRYAEGSSLALCPPLSGSFMLGIHVMLVMSKRCSDEAAQFVWTMAGCTLFNKITLHGVSVCRLVLVLWHRLVCIGPTAFALLSVSSTVQGP